MQLAMETGSE